MHTIDINKLSTEEFFKIWTDEESILVFDEFINRGNLDRYYELKVKESEYDPYHVASDFIDIISKMYGYRLGKDTKPFSILER